MNTYDKKTLTIDCFHKTTVIDDQNLNCNDSRLKHLDIVSAASNIEGYVLEFGVFKGVSINHLANLYPEDIIWGFDSFEGLPEDWYLKSTKKTRYKKSYFAVDSLPEVKKNVSLIKGWFNDTLPIWIKDYKDTIKLLHIDCDLYSSSAYVLSTLNNQIKPGTIIIFDELYNWKRPNNYKLWDQGEYKALIEWLKNYDRKIELLYRTSFQQCSIRIVK